MIADAGTTIFSTGQTYVGLSRVTKLEGLNLINFDPTSIKASEAAIIEYNRLRTLYRPDLQSINISKETNKKLKIADCRWTVPQNTISAQSDHRSLENNKNISIITGIANKYNNSYICTTVQSLFHFSVLQNILLEKHNKSEILKMIFDQYVSKVPIDIQALRNYVNVKIQWMSKKMLHNF